MSKYILDCICPEIVPSLWQHSPFCPLALVGIFIWVILGKKPHTVLDLGVWRLLTHSVNYRVEHRFFRNTCREFQTIYPISSCSGGTMKSGSCQGKGALWRFVFGRQIGRQRFFPQIPTYRISDSNTREGWCRRQIYLNSSGWSGGSC